MSFWKIKKRASRSLRFCSLLLAGAFTVLTLASCSSAPIKSSKEEMQVVGTVADREVYYDEFYYLCSSYRKGLVKKFGDYEALSADKKAEFNEELRELVYSNIITNHAILELCEEYGLVTDGEIEDRVQKYIDNVIEADFGGSRREYKNDLKENELTDRYVRFNVSADLLYSDLLAKMVEDGKIESDQDKLVGIIKNEFVRTWHIMISNDKGEDVSLNRAKAEEALSKYRDGSMSMYKLIGSTYNEDFTLTELDGFYFTHGSMDEAYEKAAYELEIGEVSEVVESIGINAKGESVSCFYVIQRLELDEEYIEKNFDDLAEKYRNSIVYDMLADKKAVLEFVPNDYAKSLELAKIEAPDPDFPVAAVVIGVGASLIAVAGIVVLVCFIIKKKRSSKNK